MLLWGNGLVHEVWSLLWLIARLYVLYVLYVLYYRWLRQPLLDEEEIFRRQEVVQAFFQSTHHRNELREGPLKAVPDLDAVLHKMHLHNAGLDEIFRLYLFVRSIPALTASLLSLVETLTAQHLEEGGSGAAEDVPASVRILCEKYVEPLQSIAGKFALYEQLVEHVIDLSRLPELRVSAAHDPELQEIEAEQAGLQARAERVLQEARTGWASFADVKLEQNAMHGFVLRTTRADDERQLRANLPTVRVISILKNGVHFTTPALERMAERYLALQGEYDTHQSALVVQALDAARTYMSVVEAVAALIAELDVLASFATAAALAPGTYVRPKVLKRGTGVINLKVWSLRYDVAPRFLLFFLSFSPSFPPLLLV